MRTISFIDLFVLKVFIFFLSDSFKSSLLKNFFSEIITVTSPLGIMFKLSISKPFPL